MNAAPEFPKAVARYVSRAIFWALMAGASLMGCALSQDKSPALWYLALFFVALALSLSKIKLAAQAWSRGERAPLGTGTLSVIYDGSSVCFRRDGIEVARFALADHKHFGWHKDADGRCFPMVWPPGQQPRWCSLDLPPEEEG